MSNGNKLIKCATCGEEIAKSAKTCPKCGSKNKKPFYKKWWVWVIVVIVIVIAASSGGSETPSDSKTGSNTPEVQETIEYTVYNVSELIDDLESNALKAETKYANQYVEITGKLSVIDSDGSYISLSSAKHPYSLTSVQCYIKNDEQKLKVAEMSKGDTVVLKGKIKDVGELLGYTLDIDSIS